MRYCYMVNNKNAGIDMDRRESDGRIVVLETKNDEVFRRLDNIDRNIEILKDLASRGRGGLATVLYVGGFVTAAVGIAASISGFMWGNK